MNKVVADLRGASGATGAAASTALLIVGMHRSGTSAISGVLAKLGVDTPADLIAADQHNLKGYFEPQKIIDFHERLFAQLGSPSNDPLPLSYDWVDSALGRAAAAELAGLLDEEMGASALCLFKDPRICRLTPVWTEALKLSGRGGLAILPCRHPLEVAGSLSAKAGLTRPYALMMWLQHVVLGERFTRAMKRSFTDYEALLNDWRAVIGKVAKDLDLVWPRDAMRAGVEVDGFLTGELRRQKPPERPLSADGLERLCDRAWAVLPALQKNPYDKKAMAELDAVGAEMDAVIAVAGPLVVSYQGELDGTRRELDKTLRGVGDLIADHDARIEAVNAEAQRHVAAVDRRIVAAEKAREALRARLTQKERDLDWAMNALHGREAEVAHQGQVIGQLNQVHGELHRTQIRLDAIENSTTWKLTGVLRRPFERSPGLRRLARGTLKMAWWMATFQVGRKLRDRRAFLAGVAAAPVAQAAETAPLAEAAAPPAAPAERTASAVPHVAFLSGEGQTPGHVYRVVRWAEAARAAGATASVAKVEDLPAQLDDFRKADLIYIWRAAWDERVASVIAVAHQSGIPILFDIDDLLMEPEQAKAEIIDGIRSQKFAESTIRDHFERVEQVFRAAEFCSAPTEMLAHRLRRHGQPAFVLPNGFDDEGRRRSALAARRRRQEPDDGLIRIGYATGSKTHQKDFAQAAEGVARVMMEHPQTRLVLFNSQWGPVLDIGEFDAFDGLADQIEWRDMVPIQQLPDELARFDINLAPLEVGNIFCESKSELKFYEAALVDRPTVASPTEPYARAIRHGETGYLATTADDWYAAVKALVEDAGLRARIAKAAQYVAVADYGPERRAELFTSVLDQTLSGRRRGARAFELDLTRKARARPAAPHVPPHRVVFEADQLSASDVTVIIPLYNYAGYVEEALESVAAQTLRDIDLIVVDDRSTDDSLAVAQQWIEANQHRFGRVLLIQNEVNSGLAFTRNVGFSNADTAFVLPLDADNRLLADCAERLMAAAAADTAAFAYPQIRQFGDSERVHGRPYQPGRLVIANFIDAMAVIRRSAWAAVGGYDHVQHGWEDYDLWCRFAETGLFGAYVAEPLAEYRVHQSSMLRSETDETRNKLRLIKDIERRHPWLRIDRDPPGGPRLPDDEPEPASPAPAPRPVKAKAGPRKPA